MKTFGRSIVLPSWQKSKAFKADGRISDEDQAYLLAPDEGREQEAVRDYSEVVSLPYEEYVRKTKVLELCCESLQKRISDIQQARLKEQARRDTEDKTIVASMTTMKEYIKRLENDNKSLTETLSKRDHGVDTPQGDENGVAHDTASTISNIVLLSNQKRKKGANWSVVADLASKLSKAQKENSSLREAMASKREAMEQLIRSTTALRSRLEHAQSENRGLISKLESRHDGKQEARSRHVVFLQARVEELEEQSLFLQKELHELRKVLSSKTGPTPSEDTRQNSIEDGSDHVGSCLVTTIKHSAEPLDAIVETVHEESEVASDAEDNKVAEVEDVQKRQLMEEGYNAPDCSSETVSEGEKKDDLLAMPPSIHSESNHEENSDPYRPASLEEMQKYLQEVIAMQVATGETDQESGVVEMTTGNENWPTSQEISDARMEILESMKKHQRWRDKVLRLEHEKVTDGCDGVWC